MVPIRIENNPGIVALSLDISYDNKQLQLLDVIDGKLLGDSVFSESNLDSIPIVLNWDDVGTSNNTESGIVATLKFQLSETAQGNIAINLGINQKSTFDANLKEIAFTAESGSISVSQTVASTTTTKAVTTTSATTTAKATTTTKAVTTTSATTTAKATTITKSVTTTSAATTAKATTTTKSVTTTAATTTAKATTTSQATKTTTAITTTTISAESNAAVIIDDFNGVAGETVKIPIRIENNPGIVAFSINISYDTEKLELIKVSDEKLFENATFSSGSDLSAIPYKLNWDDDAYANNTENGPVASLEFKIKEETIGKANITVELNPKSIFDKDLKEVAFEAHNGSVSILSKGDVDCDGSVRISDAVRLLKFITEVEGSELSENGYLVSDLDNDSLYTIMDVKLLLQIICNMKKSIDAFALDTSSISLYQTEKQSIKTIDLPHDIQIKWESSDPEIASVDNGVISANNPGTVQITAAFNYEGEIYSQTCSVTVNPIEIVFGNKTDSIYVTDTLDLQVKTAPESLDINWLISDTSILSIKEGIITAKSPGQATVTASATINDTQISASKKITVNKVAVTISKSDLSIIVGDSATLTANVLPSNLAVTWSSSNTDVLSISDGIITAKKPGKANVVASIIYNKQTYTATCAVSVTEPSLSLSSYSDSANRDVWDSTHIPDGVACGWSVFYPNATYTKGGSIKWSLVSGDAYLQAYKMIVSQPGTTTIRCTLTYKGYTVYKDYSYNLSLYKTPTETNVLRSAPSYDSAKVGSVPAGATVVITKAAVNGKPPESGSTFWGETDYNGVHGWIIISAWD